MGVVVLAGWALDLPLLQSIRPDVVTMKANTALAFFLAGLSLVLLYKEPSGQRRRIVQVCATAVLAVGTLTLGEYLTGRDFGIDQLLFPDTLSVFAISDPGRMAPQSALNFILTGLALLLLDVRTARGRPPVQFLALLAAFVAVQALIGYAFGARGFFVFRSYAPIALHVALGFTLLAVGILCARPRRGPMAVLTADDAGGWMARRLLPAIILILSVSGWLLLAGERAGDFDTTFGQSLLVLSSMATLIAAVWWNASALSRLDRERLKTGNALLHSEERFRVITENASDLITEHVRVETELERERTVAGALQRAFLPQRLPDCPGYRFGAGYHPAAQDSKVGGDFYDLFPLPGGRVAVLLGDVSGKGVDAAVYATMTRYLLRAYALEVEAPGEVLARVNRALCQFIEDDSLFVTAFYAVLNPERDTLAYANAGHWPALLARRRSAETVGRACLALGIDPDTVYPEGDLQLEPGDELVLFTDGLVEGRREDPMDEVAAVQKTLERRREEPPQQLVDELHRDAVDRADGTLRDDVALLALQCEKPR
jgi:serine phosphatase RsbU (regulator of sigma subunit)